MSADLMLGDFNVSELARMAAQLQQVDYTTVASGDLHDGTVGLFSVLDHLHAGAADAAARWADRATGPTTAPAPPPTAWPATPASPPKPPAA